LSSLDVPCVTILMSQYIRTWTRATYFRLCISFVWLLSAFALALLGKNQYSVNASSCPQYVSLQYGALFVNYSCLTVADFSYFIYRRQQEAETKVIEEETAKRIEEAIRKKVHDALHSEEFKKEMKIQEGRKKIIDDIAAQLEREKEEALAEARRKEV
jgi:hypothetical protein